MEQRSRSQQATGTEPGSWRLWWATCFGDPLNPFSNITCASLSGSGRVTGICTVASILARYHPRGVYWSRDEHMTQARPVTVLLGTFAWPAGKGVFYFPIMLSTKNWGQQVPLSIYSVTVHTEHKPEERQSRKEYVWRTPNTIAEAPRSSHTWNTYNQLFTCACLSQFEQDLWILHPI